MNRYAALGLLFAGTFAASASAATYYVDCVNGDDAWDGICEVWDGGVCGPKATIPAAISRALDGDEVIVADGVYKGEEHRLVRFYGKAITVRSKNGPDNCIIDGEGSEDPIIQFDYSETPESVLDGFMVKNCYGC